MRMSLTAASILMFLISYDGEHLVDVIYRMIYRTLATCRLA